MIGIGVGINFNVSKPMCPSTYSLLKRKILGSKLRSLCLLGIDATVDEDGFALTCPDRIDGVPLNRIRGGIQTVTVATGRKRSLYYDGHPISGDAAYGKTTSWTPKSVMVVASSIDQIAPTYSILARGNPYFNDSAWLVRDIATSNWANVWGTKRVDGVPGVLIPNGVHIHESEKSDNLDTGIVIMGYQHVVGASWRGNVFELRITDGVLSDEEREEEISLTKTFWGIS